MAAVSTGGDQDQPVVVRPGERHLRPGGRQVQAHPLQGLQAHPSPSGILVRHFLLRIYANTEVQSTTLRTISHILTVFTRLYIQKQRNSLEEYSFTYLKYKCIRGRLCELHLFIFYVKFC
jgi:hypothetical protein